MCPESDPQILFPFLQGHLQAGAQKTHMKSAKTDSISSNRQTHNRYYGNTLQSSLVLTLLPPSVTFLPSPCFSLHLKLIKSKNLMVNQENLIALHSYSTDNINKIWKYAKRCFRLLIAQYICSNCIKIGSDSKFRGVASMEKGRIQGS